MNNAFSWINFEITLNLIKQGSTIVYTYQLSLVSFSHVIIN